MIVSTMNDLPGYRVDEVLGEVTGLTVRSRNVGAQLGAGLKSIVGGELKGLTKQLQQSRDEAKQRLIEAAEAVGANAILAMRFDSDEVGTGYQELVAYGTTVRGLTHIDMGQAVGEFVLRYLTRRKSPRRCRFLFSPFVSSATIPTRRRTR